MRTVLGSPQRWSAYTDARQEGPWSLTSNRSDPKTIYPRLHVEMRCLSDTAFLVDGWLIEDAAGALRSVLNYCGSMDEARTRITACALKYHAQCNDEDIVIHQPQPAAAPSTDPPSGIGSGPS